MSRFFIVTLLGLAASSIMAFGDITVKTHTVVTEGGKTHEGTRYLYYRRGAMRRRDSIDSKGTSSIATIANCETKSGFLIDLIVREYRTYKVVKFFSDAQLAEYLKEEPWQRRAGGEPYVSILVSGRRSLVTQPSTSSLP